MAKHKEMSHHHKAHHSENKGGAHMEHDGYHQGDMSPNVMDYQKPHSDYSQEQFGKTLDYINRQDNYQKKEAMGIKKQAYQGRYS